MLTSFEVHLDLMEISKAHSATLAAIFKLEIEEVLLVSYPAAGIWGYELNTQSYYYQKNKDEVESTLNVVQSTSFVVIGKVEPSETERQSDDCV